MAELSTDAPAERCCAQQLQAICCEPSAKADCCGEDGRGCAASTSATQAGGVRARKPIDRPA